MSRVTRKHADKLRSGHTVWRCIIRQDQHDGGISVSVHEIQLKGKKYLHTSRSMFPDDVPENKRKVLFTAMQIRCKNSSIYSGNYLSDVAGHGDDVQAFTSRRAALRFKEQVEAGIMSNSLIERLEYLSMVDSMFPDYYSYDDGYDDGPYNGIVAEDPPPYSYTEPMTLGDLLRKKLDQTEAQGTVVPAGVEPLEA